MLFSEGWRLRIPTHTDMPLRFLCHDSYLFLGRERKQQIIINVAVRQGYVLSLPLANFYINDITTWQHKLRNIPYLTSFSSNYKLLYFHFSNCFLFTFRHVHLYVYLLKSHYLVKFIFLFHVLLYFFRCFRFLLLTLFMSISWDHVSELQPPAGILFILMCEYSEPRWNEVDRGKPVPVQLCPPQIPHGIKRASPARAPVPTAWAFRYLPCWSSMTH
jgi:hypothetical protein